jgi:hypothetical protein
VPFRAILLRSVVVWLKLGTSRPEAARGGQRHPQHRTGRPSHRRPATPRHPQGTPQVGVVYSGKGYALPPLPLFLSVTGGREAVKTQGQHGELMQYEPANHGYGGSPPAGKNAREDATQDPSWELPSEADGLRLGDRAACPHLSLSRLSQALAGEIGREPVHTQGEREFATVVQVVFHHMPDDPGARQVDVLAVPVVGEGLLHVVGAPARQALGHALPGAVEGLHHLGGCSGGRAVLIQARVRLHVGVAVFAQEMGEPAGTAADDVQGNLADRAQVRGCSQRKLLGGEQGERRFDVILVRFPGRVERRQREVVFSHGCSLLGWYAASLKAVAGGHAALS